jgi:hypothetical protein
MIRPGVPVPIGRETAAPFVAMLRAAAGVIARTMSTAPSITQAVHARIAGLLGLGLLGIAA